MGLESTKPNHVLLLSLSNVQDPIDVDVIRRISCNYGDLKRIVVIDRYPQIQVLIEYGDACMAKIAKDDLNGAEIYEGSCLIRAEYSSVESVRVYRNDAKHWDYTKPFLDGRSRKRRFDEETGPDDEDSHAPPRRVPLLDINNRLQPYGGSAPVPLRDVNSTAFNRSSPFPVSNHQPPNAMPKWESCYSPVLMLYGIDQTRFSCDKLFNLFCVYGNCIRVKFLKNKPDTAMIEMGSQREAQTVVDNVQGIELFGRKFLLEPSRQKNLQTVDDPFTMPDGTQSFADYSGNKNHRFIDERNAQRNRIVKPSKQLYWFDAPPGISEGGIQKIFQMKSSTVPDPVTKFHIKTEKVAVGTCDFPSVEAATEALMLCNHAKVQLASQSDLFVLKLAFSGSWEKPRKSRFQN